LLSQREKRPGELVACVAPIAAGADPEPGQQVVLARLLRLLGREFGIGLDDIGRRRFDVIAVFGDDLDDRRLVFARFGVVAGLVAVARLWLGVRLGHDTPTPVKLEGSRQVPLEAMG